MRKLPLFLSFMVFTISLALGQKRQYGLRAGLGFATQNIENPDIVSTNSLTTYYIDVYSDFHVKKSFYLEPGITVLGKGVKEYQNAQTNTITLTYLDLSATGLFKFELTGLGKLYIGTGPYAAIGLSGNNQLEGVNNATGSNISFGNSEDYRKIDIGLNGVAGLELNNHLTFNMKYSLGLNNIASSDPSDVNTTSVKNRIFTIGLGFWL